MKSSPTNKTVAIVLGAGKGSRSDLGYNKMFFPMGEKTVIQTAGDKFRIPEISEIIVVAAQSDLCRVKAMFPDLTVIAGGKTRSDSVRRALEHLESKSFKVALIHDGARPFVSQKLIRKVIKTAAASGSAIPVLPVVDALKEVSDGYIRTTLVRDVTACAQTPQGFEFMRIRRAYALTIGEFADDSEVYERSGYDPKTVPGEFSNVKLTYPHDFMRAEFMSVGYGFDVHQLREGRPLILGGVTIPYERGLYGHSDADVLIHAVIDAVLASAGLPDIGVNFPDTDPQYKDISSAVLLERAMSAVKKAGYRVGSVSATVVAEAPRLAPYIVRMRASLAALIGINKDKVSVSATTSENLGATAEGKGIAAKAVAISYRVIPENENRQ